MKRQVTIRVSPLWDRTREEHAFDAAARVRQAMQDAADRRLEDEWRARVARNVALRRAKRLIAGVLS